MKSFLKYKFARILFSLMLITALTGIGCMPRSMTIRTGSEPRYQDDDTRFKTVYYFRVFEYCKNPTTSVQNNNQKPQKDNLYRFIMTGKGSSLWNDIHFESGFLHKSEIDPLGALITYDSEDRQFRFKSQREIESTKRKKILEDVNEEFNQLVQLNKMYYGIAKKSLAKADSSEPAKANKKDSPSENKEASLENAKPGENGSPSTPNRTSSETAKPEKMDFGASGKKLEEFLVKRAESLISSFQEKTSSFQQNTSTSGNSPSLCDNNSPATQESWVLGPEGWRRFDPDERLILAMSSSGKPLISAMKELSGRILNEKSDSSDNREILLEEQSKISEALRKLPDSKTEQSSQTIVNGVIETLSPTTTVKENKGEPNE